MATNERRWSSSHEDLSGSFGEGEEGPQKTKFSKLSKFFGDSNRDLIRMMVDGADELTTVSPRQAPIIEAELKLKNKGTAVTKVITKEEDPGKIAKETAKRELRHSASLPKTSSSPSVGDTERSRTATALPAQPPDSPAPSASPSAGKSAGSTKEELASPREPKYGVAFGVKRGKCTVCSCEAYDPEDSAKPGPCRMCGHFPAKHVNLGKVGEAVPSSPLGGVRTRASSGPNAASPSLAPTPALTSSASSPSLAVAVAAAAAAAANPTPSNTTPPNQAASTADSNGGDSDPAAKVRKLFAGGSSWVINQDELVFGEVMALGTSATVYAGTYRDQEVSIKVLNNMVSDPKQMENFKKEMELMATLKSRHVVYYYGTCLEPKIAIVTEYCSRGSLYHMMQAKSLDISWPLAFKLLTGAVQGLLALHSWKPPIVHRDLKTLNLLVDEGWNVKVCDFGLSRFTTEANVSTLKTLRGSFTYSAPEVFLGEQFSPKSDVYSLAIVMWEVFMRCLLGEYVRPYAEYNRPEHNDFWLITQTARKGLRPQVPQHCPAAVVALLKACWDPDPRNRPDCMEILDRLASLQAEYEANREAWDAQRTSYAAADSRGAVAPPTPLSTTEG